VEIRTALTYLRDSFVVYFLFYFSVGPFVLPTPKYVAWGIQFFEALAYHNFLGTQGNDFPMSDIYRGNEQFHIKIKGNLSEQTRWSFSRT